MRSERGSALVVALFVVVLLTGMGTGLLFLSQQYHPHGRARSTAGELETVTIDGFFQGVLVPVGTAEIELAFEPWVRWAWLPQACFTLAGALALLGALRRRRVTDSTGC